MLGRACCATSAGCLSLVSHAALQSFKLRLSQKARFFLLKTLVQLEGLGLCVLFCAEAGTAERLILAATQKWDGMMQHCSVLQI